MTWDFSPRLQSRTPAPHGTHTVRRHLHFRDVIRSKTSRYQPCQVGTDGLAGSEALSANGVKPLHIPHPGNSESVRGMESLTLMPSGGQLNGWSHYMRRIWAEPSFIVAMPRPGAPKVNACLRGISVPEDYARGCMPMNTRRDGPARCIRALLRLPGRSRG